MIIFHMMLIIKVGSEDDKGDEFDEFDRKVKGKDDIVSGKSKDTDPGKDNAIVLHRSKSKDDTDSDQDKKGDEKGRSNLWTQETVDRLIRESETPGPGWPKDKNYQDYLDKGSVIGRSKDDNDSGMKQRALGICRRYEAKDIVEYDIVQSPKHVSVMLKFKKKEGIVKDIGEGKSMDDKSDMGDSDNSTTEEQLNKMTEDQLNNMTKDQLHRLLASHGKQANNKSRIRKGELIELIVEGNFNWKPAVDKSEGKDKKGKSKSNVIASD